MMAPDRNAPTIKCRPDQSAPRPHRASHIKPTYHRSRSGNRTMSWRKVQAAIAKPVRNTSCLPMRCQSISINASTTQIATLAHRRNLGPMTLNGRAPLTCNAQGQPHLLAAIRKSAFMLDEFC